MNELIVAISPYLPYIYGALPFVLATIVLAIRGELKTYARSTVAAVYRAGLHAANAVQDEGIQWLQSEAGIKYRKNLASDAYKLLPEKVGRVPIGLLKRLITEEQFCALVESAFQEAVELAEKLESAEERPSA